MMDKIVADMHTHTLVSGHAFGTLQENLRAASERGLQFVAATEHGPAMPGAPHKWYFSNMRVLPRELYGVRLIKGVEANLMNVAGDLDLEERLLANLEYVAVGFHEDCIQPGSQEENTAALLNAIANPLVDTVVHPGNPRFPIDFPRVLAAAAEQGVLVEINNSSLISSRIGSEEFCREIASLAARHGYRVVLGSDAHWWGDVGNLSRALELARSAGIPDENILNLSVARVESFIDERLARKTSGKRIALK